VGKVEQKWRAEIEREKKMGDKIFADLMKYLFCTWVALHIEDWLSVCLLEVRFSELKREGGV